MPLNEINELQRDTRPLSSYNTSDDYQSKPRLMIDRHAGCCETDKLGRKRKL